MSSPSSVTAFNEDHAAVYDQRFAKMAAIRDVMNLLMRAILCGLPADARILCVGAGTGLEIAVLAEHFPGWTFTAVEPAPAMLKICRQRAETLGITDRCTFHEGYLDSLPTGELFHAATSLLVSHFIVDLDARQEYFRQIAVRLRPGGVLISADLSGDKASPVYPEQEAAWFRLMTEQAEIPTDQVEKMREAYRKEVGILPPAKVAELIAGAGFETPVPFLQTLLIHGWFSRRLQTA